MPTPAYLRAYPYPLGSVAANSTATMNWLTGVSSTITLPNITTISCPAIGTYVFTCYITLASSTDSGTSFATAIQWCIASLAASSDFVLGSFITTTTVANQQFKLNITNGMSTVCSWNAAYTVSCLRVHRIA